MKHNYMWTPTLKNIKYIKYIHKHTTAHSHSYLHTPLSTINPKKQLQQYPLGLGPHGCNQGRNLTGVMLVEGHFDRQHIIKMPVK